MQISHSGSRLLHRQPLRVLDNKHTDSADMFRGAVQITAQTIVCSNTRFYMYVLLICPVLCVQQWVFMLPKGHMTLESWTADKALLLTCTLLLSHVSWGAQFVSGLIPCGGILGGIDDLLCSCTFLLCWGVNLRKIKVYVYIDAYASDKQGQISVCLQMSLTLRAADICRCFFYLRHDVASGIMLVTWLNLTTSLHIM